MTKYFTIALLSLFLFSCSEESPLKSYDNIDLVIENATIIDGFSPERYQGNIYIVNNEIVYVGASKWQHPGISRTIDASGLIVAPGFIDLHAHGNPLKTPDFENFLAMGVTTITLGQDGSSPNTPDIKEWLEKVDSVGIGVNLAMMVGHGTLRRLSGIGTKSTPTEGEKEAFDKLLADNLEVCFGLSTGLEYTPGLYAETEELQSMAIITGKMDRMIMSHMRNEDDDQLFNSMDELINQGKHCRVHIAHLKSVYGKGVQRAEEILEKIYTARGEGIEITADLYPYTASYTGISILFPEWSKSADQFNKVKITRRKELEDFLRNKVMRRNGPEATLLGTDPYTGKTLADLEKEYKKPFEKILIDDIGPQGSSGAYFVMDEELQSRLIQDSLVSVCSDGSPTGFHPRGHGTFARVIDKYVVNDQVLSLEAAVHKMSTLAADILKIKDRGRIKKGMKADIIVFDPMKVKAKATYPEPHQLSEGFQYVIVNGQVAREDNTNAKALYGNVIYPQ